MKKAKQADKTSQRMLPPLDNLTMEDWSRICDKVDSKYEWKDADTLLTQEDK